VRLVERHADKFTRKEVKSVQRSLIAVLTAGIVLTVLIAGHAYSGTSDTPAGSKKEEGKTLKTGQAGSVGAVAPSKSGSSVVERDKKRYENQKRAADRRAAEMKKAEEADIRMKDVKQKEPVDAQGQSQAK
jgi:hypothetical protein